MNSKILQLFGLILLLNYCSSETDIITRKYSKQENYRDCGRLVYTGHTGFISSHRHFGRRLYPSNFECVWRIITPPGTRIAVFPSSMSLEYDADCAFDYMAVYDGSTTNATCLGFACGSQTDSLFVSTGSRLTIKFRSDSSTNKEGFSLRYVTIPAASRPPGGCHLKRSGRNCTDTEFKCSNGLCTPRGVQCDRLDDCGDQSDETACVHVTQSTCGPAFYQCGGDSFCLPRYLKCDGVADCPDSDDEHACGPDGVFAPVNGSDTFDSTVDTRAACGKSKVPPKEDSGRIVGGDVARRGSWPWTVSLHNNGGHVCGGSILSKRWILTAAHCVEGSENPRNWEIKAGLHRDGESGRRVQSRKVSRIIVHPRWDTNTINYDLTLMRLSKSLKWTKYVRPICLPTKQVSRRAKCYIAGWGETKGTGGAGNLKQGRVNTFSNRQCSRWYGGGITSKMICAGRREGGVDSCQGDSGGPLMCEESGKYVLHGVTSFGGECGAPNSPGVYARVASMVRWVKSKVGNTGSDSGSGGDGGGDGDGDGDGDGGDSGQSCRT